MSEPSWGKWGTWEEAESFVGKIVGVTKSSKLVSLVKKELRVGAGAFFKQKDTYTNQNDDVVAVAHLDIFRFNPPNKGDS